MSGLLNVGGVRGSARCQYRPVAVVADVAATSNNNSNSNSNSVLSASASVHELRITHRFDYQQPHGSADEQASSGAPAAAAVVMTTSDNNDDSPAKTNKKNKQKKSYQLPAGTAS